MMNKSVRLIFPPKCVLCGQLLGKEETDLCHACRENPPEAAKGKFNISFVARWTALWYYKENVRESLLRYKFRRRRNYGLVYGRLLAMHLKQKGFDDFDILTWVPISFRRRWKRGFDQVAVIANVCAEELGCTACPVLKKIRHNPPQSGLTDVPMRRANVLNAYKVRSPSQVVGQRILLLDDIITTGATLSECAKILHFAGAEKVTGAAIAVAEYDKKKN